MKPTSALMPILGVLTGSLCAPLWAQESTARPASLEACLALASDTARLACYDQASGYIAPTTEQADQAAVQAQALLEQQRAAALPADAGLAERARQRRDELFRRDDLAFDPDDRAAIANAGRGSLLDSRWELAADSKLGVFQLRAYKPVYVLPAFWTSKVNTHPHSPNPDNALPFALTQVDDLEVKFQISFKTKVVEDLFGDTGDIWVGYTQSSRWQAYNSATSRPFRETNYEPEAMLVFRNNYSLLGWRGRLFGVGLNHQSNGQSDPLSRSWNRMVFDIGLDRGNWALMLRPWYRIPEGRKDDNNPDIDDYVGRGDATLVWHKDGHEVALMARHSFRGGDRSHGAVQLDWGFPINNLLRGHLQVFDGYGESMIDYNHRATYVGVGISLLEWF